MFLCIKKNNALVARKILRNLCARKGIEIIEGEVCPDDIHILVSLPPKLALRESAGILKDNKPKNKLKIFFENFRISLDKFYFLN